MKQTIKGLLILGILILLIFVGIIQAQDKVVTDDEVNAIAAKLYCPVCENIPLDTCPTAACADWRYEIRLQLQDGKSEEQIIDDFVTRFGDRVVGTPQDPVLRALSLVTPFVVIFLAAIGVGYALLQWRTGSTAHEMPSKTSNRPLDDYQALLEQDLAEE